MSLFGPGFGWALLAMCGVVVAVLVSALLLVVVRLLAPAEKRFVWSRAVTAGGAAGVGIHVVSLFASAHSSPQLASAIDDAPVPYLLVTSAAAVVVGALVKLGSRAQLAKPAEENAKD